MNRCIPLTLLALVSLTGPVFAAETAIVDPDSHLCLSVSSAGVAESSCGAATGQQFVIAEQPDGYALVRDATGRDCLTAAAGHLGVKECNASQTDQMFKPIAQQVDGYALLNRRSGLCISSAGGQVSLADCESKSATHYRMPGWASAQPARPSATGARSNTAVLPPATGLVISGLHIQGDYALYGNKFDGATLTNSTITGSLKIDGVHNLRVQGNHLNSVWFRGQQPTDAVTIEGNEIAGAANDCVQIHDGGVYPTHVLIEKNDIYNCGNKYPASGLYHAIYDQVPDVTIRQNHIWDAKSAISIRSSGVVDGNTIERVTNGGAIEYFSDHAAPDHSSLILQNNVITTTLTNAPSALGSKRGLIILGNGIAANKAAVSSIVLQNNMVRLLNNAADDSGDYFVVYIQAAAPPVKLLGNTFNNAIPNGECIGPGRFEAAQRSLCSHLPQ
jgi:hypothetical protein